MALAQGHPTAYRGRTLVGAACCFAPGWCNGRNAASAELSISFLAIASIHLPRYALRLVAFSDGWCVGFQRDRCGAAHVVSEPVPGGFCGSVGIRSCRYHLPARELLGARGCSPTDTSRLLVLAVPAVVPLCTIALSEWAKSASRLATCPPSLRSSRLDSRTACALSCSSSWSPYSTNAEPIAVSALRALVEAIVASWPAIVGLTNRHRVDRRS